MIFFERRCPGTRSESAPQAPQSSSQALSFRSVPSRFFFVEHPARQLDWSAPEVGISPASWDVEKFFFSPLIAAINIVDRHRLRTSTLFPSLSGTFPPIVHFLSLAPGGNVFPELTLAFPGFLLIDQLPKKDIRPTTFFFFPPVGGLFTSTSAYARWHSSALLSFCFSLSGSHSFERFFSKNLPPTLRPPSDLIWIGWSIHFDAFL